MLGEAATRLAAWVGSIVDGVGQGTKRSSRAKRSRQRRSWRRRRGAVVRLVAQLWLLAGLAALALVVGYILGVLLIEHLLWDVHLH